MSTPWTHAQSAAKRWGGKPEDYLAIHTLMDDTKTFFPDDHRHRVFTHNTFFTDKILPAIFGDTIVNGAGEQVPVMEIGRWHLKEDFDGALPSPTEWAAAVQRLPWMSDEPGFAEGRELVEFDEFPRARRIPRQHLGEMRLD